MTNEENSEKTGLIGLMKVKPIILLMVIFLAVLTIYLVFQFSGLAAESNFNRDYSGNIIAQIRLKSLQFILDSDAISEGYFVSNLTFENPTSEKPTLTSVHGECYYHNSSTGSTGMKLAEGWTDKALVIPPGSSQMALRMDFNLYSTQNPNAAIASSYQWMIYYRLKLGYVSYQMMATVTDSTIQYEGPSYPSDEIYTVADTYTSSIISVWIIGFEIVALSLIRKERGQKTVATSASEKHNVMLSIIYALQGLGIFVAPIYYRFIYALIPRPPLPSGYIPYGGHGVSEMAAGFLLLAFNVIALVFLFVAIGLFFKKNWARKAATPISVLLTLVFSLAVPTTLKPLIDQGQLITYNIALGVLFSAVAIAHGTGAYLLAFRRPKTEIPQVHSRV